MNPANKSLQRTYFIGGPPRVGKSLLAYRFARKINGHVVSTDSIRSAANKAHENKEDDNFAVRKLNDLTEKEWLDLHNNRTRELISIQNKESRAIFPSIVSYCNSFADHDEKHIVEGVALLPSLIAKMKHKPAHIIFVGNTDKNHVEAIIGHSQDYPERDRMTAMGYSRERIEAMAHFSLEMSRYFKKEAEKYGFSYFEISDSNFEKSLDIISNELI